MNFNCNLPLLFLLLFFQHFYSQNTLKGKVSNENATISGAEIINITKKCSVKSNVEGVFIIKAEINDELLVYLEGYIQKRFKVQNENLLNENAILLIKKPIEMEAINIVKAPTIKIASHYDDLKTAELVKDELKPKVIGVYTGKIEKGMDVMAIGGKAIDLIAKLFKKSHEKKKNKNLSFATIVRKKLPQDFFSLKLQLNESEIELFLTFCEKDKASTIFSEQSNELELIDFLFLKRKAFK